MADDSKQSYNVAHLYEADGDNVKRKNKTCPKCGPGVYLAEHKDRVSCGKCSYSERK
ncbi:MAG: 30S ribosomal protein S27ae [Candidatus Woesearchaeota archaeon]